MDNKITRLCKMMLIPVLVVSLTACGTTASKGDKICAVKGKSHKQTIEELKDEQSKHKKSKTGKKKAKRSKKKKFNFQGDANHPMVKKSGGRLLFARELKRKSSRKNDFYFAKYIDYDKYFLKDGEKQSFEGRYSNFSNDKKLNLTKGQTHIKNATDANELLGKVTFNGKPIKLPMNFKDLGKEYAAFDSVDFSKLNDDCYPLYIKDTKTGLILHTEVPTVTNLPIVILRILDKNSRDIVTVNVDKKDNKIYGIGSSYYYLKQCTADLKVNGIGIGSTLNEVYEKNGIPRDIDDAKKSIIGKGGLSYFNGEGKYDRLVAFYSDCKKCKWEDFPVVRANTVTEVVVWFMEKDSLKNDK